MKEIPPPAPLVFTPSKSQDDTKVEVEVSDDKDNLSCWNCDAEMTPDSTKWDVTIESPEGREGRLFRNRQELSTQ